MTSSSLRSPPSLPSSPSPSPPSSSSSSPSSSSSSSSSDSFSLSDYNRGSGVIEFDVDHFSKLAVTTDASGEYHRRNGPKFLLQDMYFWINIGKVIRPVQTRERVKNVQLLSFYIMMSPGGKAITKDKGQWFCFASLEFQLIPANNDPDLRISWKSDELFYVGNESCGFDNFEEVDNLVNKWKNEYTPNDTLHLRIVLKNMTFFTCKPTRSIASKYYIKSEEMSQSDVYHLFARKNLSDIIFQCKHSNGSIRMIHVHRFILESRCEAFATAFRKHFSHKYRCLQFDSDTFREVIAFLYRFEFHFDPVNLPKYLKIARKLKLIPLKQLCYQFMNASHCLIIMADCLEEHVPYDDSFGYAAELLQEQTHDILSLYIRGKMDPIHVTKGLIKRILVNESLQCREIVIYDFVMKWLTRLLGNCINHQLMREMIGEDVYNIRFNCMSAQEFSNGPAVGQLLTPDEKIDIYKMITNPGSVDLSVYPFAKQPRDGSGLCQDS